MIIVARRRSQVKCLQCSYLQQLTYEGGVPLKASFAIMAGATLLFLVNTFGLLPKDHIPWPLPPNYGTKEDKKYNVDLESDKQDSIVKAKVNDQEVTTTSEEDGKLLIG